MAKRMWDQVEEMARAGRHPLVTLPKALQIVEPKKARGRPRLRPVGVKGWRWGWTMKTASGQPMTCRRPGCRRYIGKDAETIVCTDPDCHAYLMEYTKAVLDVLEGRVKARYFPFQFRARAGSRKQKQRKAA